MANNKFNEIRQTATALPPEQMRQLRDELDLKLAALAAAELPEAGGEPDADPLLGLWRDYADEIDEIVADTYRKRREGSGGKTAVTGTQLIIMGSQPQR